MNPVEKREDERKSEVLEGSRVVDDEGDDEAEIDEGDDEENDEKNDEENEYGERKYAVYRHALLKPTYSD